MFVSLLAYQLSVAVVFEALEEVLLDILVEVEPLDVEPLDVELLVVGLVVVPDVTVNVTGIQTFPPCDAATLMVVV